MSMYSSRRRSRQASRSQLGHLKLSVYEDASSLVVHIIEARGLLRKENAPFDTYVKIYLLPDPQKSTKQKTKIVKNQKDPIFNEKFTFILNENDQEKKLFISVWTPHFTSRNDMVGCMTFLLSDLVGPSKGLNGWYRLLDEIKGRNENIQVPNSITKYSAQIEVAQQPGGYQVFAVTLVRGERGYGFSVFGHNPVCITEVAEGLPAHQSDIKVGDIIMEVESTDVTRANGDLVVSIVRKCPKTLQLILRRPLIPTIPTTGRQPSFLGPPGQSRVNSSSLRVRSRSSNAVSLSQQEEPLAFTSQARAQYSSSQYLAPESHEYRRNSTQFTTDFGLTQPVSTYGRGVVGGDPSRLEPDPYVRHSYGRRRKHKPRSHSHNRIPEEPRVDVRGGGFADQDQHESSTLPGQKFRGNSSSITNLSSRPPRYSSRGYMGSQEHLRLPAEVGGRSLAAFGGSVEAISPAVVSGHHHALTQPIGVYPEEEEEAVGMGWSQERPVQHPRGRPPLIFVEGESVSDRRRVKRDLVRSSSLKPQQPIGEQTDTMATGHAHSNGSLSSGNGSKHVVKATNAEEEVPVTWESLGFLGQTRQKAMNNLVNAELAFRDELAVGMETYVKPLRAILPESTHSTMFFGLAELYGVSKEISSELKRRKMSYVSPDPLVSFYVPHVADIYWTRLDRLVRGLQTYMENGHNARQEIVTAFTNEEFTKHVQDAVVDKKKPSIYSFVEAGKEYFPKLCKALMTLVYFTPVLHEDQKHLSNIVDAIMKLSSDKELMSKWEGDQEVMKSMQIRVGFSTKVRAIVVRVPGRMLLQEAEVTIVEKRKKKKVWLLLFSDMMLVTRKQGKVITTVEEPVFLENLIVQDINCEATEFQIQTADRTFSRLIRVSNEAEKKEWMDKLKERATGSLGNKRKPPIGDKVHNIRFKEALRLQSKQLLAATLAVDEPETNNGITVLPAQGEGAGVEGRGGADEVDDTLSLKKKSGAQSKRKADDSPLKRGTSMRWSLFNLGGGKNRTDSPSAGKKRKERQASFDSKKTALDKIDVEILKKWEVSFSSMLESADGLELFEEFLKSEFSDENIHFWKTCERFKTLPEHKLEKEAVAIFEEYIAPRAPKMVNIDYQTTQEVKENMKRPNRETFSKAQQSIYLLMARDSFVRFVKAEPFQQALKR